MATKRRKAISAVTVYLPHPANPQTFKVGQEGVDRIYRHGGCVVVHYQAGHEEQYVKLPFIALAHIEEYEDGN